MTTILLAYAPSATSEAALEFAVAEARLREASLLVLASERHADPRKARGVKDHRPLAERLAETGLDVELRTRSEEHTSELQSRGHLVCRLLLEKKKCRMIFL